VSYSVVFFWIHRPSVATCTSRIWFGGLGFIFCIGPIFVKAFWTWKVSQLTTKSPQIITLSNKQLLLPILPLIVIELIILIVWTTVDPYGPTYTNQNAAENEVIVVCQSQYNLLWLCLFFIYKGIIMLVGAFLAFKARHVPSKYKETRNIMYTIYNACFVAAFIVPIVFLVDMHPDVRFAISCLALLWVVTFTMVVMLASKIWLIFNKVVKSNSSTDQDSINRPKSQEMQSE